MMKRIVFVFFAVTLCSSVVVRSARAQDGPDSRAEQHHGDKGDRKKWFQKKLGLTDVQVNELDEARKAHSDAVKPLRDNLKAAMRKLRGEIDLDATNEEISSALAGVSAARKALRDEDKKFRQKMASSLTPLQQAKMLIMRDKMRHRYMGMGRGYRDGDRRERWGEPRPGDRPGPDGDNAKDGGSPPQP